MNEREKIHQELILPVSVLDQIEQAVIDVGFGSVTLIVQDSKLIQIEKLDKIRVGDRRRPPLNEPNLLLRNKLAEAVQAMDFGQVVIIIKNNRVVQIERTEKQRVNVLEGLYGDGI